MLVIVHIISFNPHKRNSDINIGLAKSSFGYFCNIYGKTQTDFLVYPIILIPFTGKETEAQNH